MSVSDRRMTETDKQNYILRYTRNGNIYTPSHFQKETLVLKEGPAKT